MPEISHVVNGPIKAMKREVVITLSDLIALQKPRFIGAFTLSNVGFVTNRIPAGNYNSTITIDAGSCPTPNCYLFMYYWNLVPQTAGIPTGYFMGDDGGTANNATNFNQRVDVLKNVSIQIEGFDT